MCVIAHLDKFFLARGNNASGRSKCICVLAHRRIREHRPNWRSNQTTRESNQLSCQEIQRQARKNKHHVSKSFANKVSRTASSPLRTPHANCSPTYGPRSRRPRGHARNASPVIGVVGV